MKKIHLFGATLLSIVLVGAGCGSATKTPSDSAAAPAAPAAAAPAVSFIDTVSAKLTAGKFNFTKDDISSKLSLLGIESNVKSSAKFKIMGDTASIEVVVFDLNSAADNTAVKAALEKNFTALKQTSNKYQAKVLSIGGQSAVVGMTNHVDDSAYASQIEAALVK